MLNAPEPGQLLYKIMRPEDLIRSMTLGYLHFNRVDCYRDFKGADMHDGEQLPGDIPGNTATKFEKAPHFSAADYYARSRSRTYACCFSLDNSEHIWREYAIGSANGKVGLKFEFGKFRARLNEALQPDKCMLQADGKPCLQIFSVNYGMVEYVDWTTYRANTERFPIQLATISQRFQLRCRSANCGIAVRARPGRVCFCGRLNDGVPQ